MAYSMNSRFVQVVRECVAAAALVGLLASGAVAEEKKDAAKEPAVVTGRVEFDCPGLPEANVEFNLSQGMVKDLFGISNAAVAGAFEGWGKAAGFDPGEADCMPKAAQQILELVSQVMQGVQVRVYEGQKAVGIKEVAAYYRKQLAAQNWETLIRVREADELYVVNVLRNSGAIKGVFVIWYDGHDLGLVNAVCDVSPENMQKLASSATALGLTMGFDPEESSAALNFLWTPQRNVGVGRVENAPAAQPAAQPKLPSPKYHSNPPPAPVGDK